MIANKINAGFGIRLLAGLIDGVIITVTMALLRSVFSFFGQPTVNTLVSALYSILLWVNWNGQTPGKRAMGIKVVRMDGRPLGYPEAIIRYVGYIISALPLFLGFLWIIWDEKKQGWHDKIAKTLVIKE